MRSLKNVEGPQSRSVRGMLNPAGSLDPDRQDINLLCGQPIAWQAAVLGLLMIRRCLFFVVTILYMGLHIQSRPRTLSTFNNLNIIYFERSF